MDSEIEQWFEATKDNKWGSTIECATFASYLSESIFVKETAASITKTPTATDLPANTKVARVWAMFFSCVENCPSAHLQIIKLIKAITTLPKPAGSSQTEGSDTKLIPGRKEDKRPKLFVGLDAPLNAAASNTTFPTSAYWTDQAVFEELWLCARECKKCIGIFDRTISRTVPTNFD